MAELELLDYYKKMCERKIVLDFQGAISQDMLVGMAELVKNKFITDLGQTGLVKRIFSIFVEMAQNIAFYSEERVRLENHDTDVGVGIIMVSEVEKKIYNITSGNLVKTAAIPRITRHCDCINHMEKDDLKKFYKERIKAVRETGRHGAGVGLIDIARKSGSPIVYKVTDVDDTNSFLVLSVKIDYTGGEE